jgi:hypothetical protein
MLHQNGNEINTVPLRTKLYKPKKGDFTGVRIYTKIKKILGECCSSGDTVNYFKVFFHHKAVHVCG